MKVQLLSEIITAQTLTTTEGDRIKQPLTSNNRGVIQWNDHSNVKRECTHCEALSTPTLTLSSLVQPPCSNVSLNPLLTIKHQVLSTL